jgi:hypothetical protein
MDGLAHTKKVFKSNIPIFWVLGIILFSIQIPWMHDRLSENRWYRNATLITPFHGVKVFDTEITDTGLIVTGELIKRRCTFDALVGYVTYTDGTPEKRVVIDDSPEGYTGDPNRPASPKAQSWGPWIVVWSAESVTPTGYKIYAQHVECPSEPVIQDNLFAEGPWIDFHTPISGD